MWQQRVDGDFACSAVRVHEVPSVFRKVPSVFLESVESGWCRVVKGSKVMREVSQKSRHSVVVSIGESFCGNITPNVQSC